MVIYTLFTLAAWVKYLDLHQRTLFLANSQPPTPINAMKVEDGLQIVRKIDKPRGLTIVLSKTNAISHIREIPLIST